MLAGNKNDVLEGGYTEMNGSAGAAAGTEASTSYGSLGSRSDTETDTLAPPTPSSQSSHNTSFGLRNSATVAPEGREVPFETASRWAGTNNIPVAVEVSALSGEHVDELFHRLARIILTKIELGEIDPDDPSSGIQYGDSGGWGFADEGDGSVKSGIEGEGVRRRRRKGGQLREWEEVFRLGGGRRRGGCC